MPQHFVPPDRLGNFSLDRALGRGSMGSVFLYHRVQPFRQQVAIKFLHTSTLIGTAPELTLRSLDHPNIARVLDLHQTPAGTPAIVMDYIAGTDLHTFCTSNHLALADRVRLFLPVVEAVAFAHARLLAHGDIKPANILVDSNGTPHLIDFGLAAWYPANTAAPTFFSPGFSSPEQRLGTIGTVPGDIFSLGRTLEHILAPAPARSPRLAAILAKATHPNPAQRFRSAADFAADLTALLECRPVQAYRQDRREILLRWAMRNPVLASILVTLVALLSLASISISIETVRAVHGRRVAQARVRELVTLTGSLQRELYDALPQSPTANSARESLLSHVASTVHEVQADTSASSSDDPALAAELAAQQKVLLQQQTAARELQHTSR